MAEKLLGNSVRSNEIRNWDADEITRRIKGKPKTARIAKRADNREWRNEANLYVSR